MIDPIIKAPKAGENPTFEARITINKQRASDTINSISSERRCFVFFSKVGTKKIPATNQIVRKKISFNTDKNNSLPENC